jgi:hypothetical protein
MTETTFVLRLHDTRNGTYAVAAIDLPEETPLEQATEIVIGDLAEGLRLERITNPNTGESASLQSIARAPRGFGQ